MAVPTVEATYTSVQGDGGNVGLAVTTDTTPTTGDYLVVCICVNANGDTITPPGSWTEATVGDNSIATTGGQIRAYYLKDPADSTTYTWSVSSSTRRSIIGVLVRGVHGTTPIDVKGSNQSGAGTNHTPPSLTTTVNDCLILDFAGLRQFSPDTANWTVPTGLSATEHADVQGADSNNNVRLAAGSFSKASAGAVSTTVWTSSDVNEDSIIIRLAFQPSASGTNASAENAAVTVASNSPTVGISPPAGNTAATATANSPTVGIGVAAGNAAATVTAYDATITASSNVPGGNATVGAASNSPTVGASPNAGNATATVTAYDATVSTTGGTNANAENATATATANSPTVGVSPSAGNAAASVTAGAPTGGVGPSGGNATVGAASNSPTIGVSPGGGDAVVSVVAGQPAVGLGVAGGTTAASVTANSPTPSVGASAGNAAATVTAYDATVSTTGGAVSVSAGAVAASVTAYDATVSAVSTQRGSWYTLLAITREARQLAEQERSAPPVACPRCGEPLESARGVLHCKFDGWVDR